MSHTKPLAQKIVEAFQLIGTLQLPRLQKVIAYPTRYYYSNCRRMIKRKKRKAFLETSIRNSGASSVKIMISIRNKTFISGELQTQIKTLASILVTSRTNNTRQLNRILILDQKKKRA